jgi:hypothetical protein
MYRWNKVGAPGQIPGYATHVEATSRAAKYTKSGGYIGIGIGGVSSLLAVREVCNGGGSVGADERSEAAIFSLPIESGAKDQKIVRTRPEPSPAPTEPSGSKLPRHRFRVVWADAIASKLAPTV